MKPYKIIKSNIHHQGLCAARNIKIGEKIIEYVGKKITHKQAENNTKYGYDVTYLFTINKKYLLDGDFKFNTARLINHSCDPNCEVDIIKNEIWISSIKLIKKGEELNYDYGYPFDEDDYSDHICKCKSKKCIGYIISQDDWAKYRNWKKKLSKNNRKKVPFDK